VTKSTGKVFKAIANWLIVGIKRASCTILTQIAWVNFKLKDLKSELSVFNKSNKCFFGYVPLSQLAPLNLGLHIHLYLVFSLLSNRQVPPFSHGDSEQTEGLVNKVSQYVPVNPSEKNTKFRSKISSFLPKNLPLQTQYETLNLRLMQVELFLQRLLFMQASTTTRHLSMIHVKSILIINIDEYFLNKI
jgi:hypothetical protein